MLISFSNLKKRKWMYIHLYSLTRQVFYFRKAEGLSWDFCFYSSYRTLVLGSKAWRFTLNRFSFTPQNFLFKTILSKNDQNYWYIKTAGKLNKEDVNLRDTDFLSVASREKQFENDDVKTAIIPDLKWLESRVQESSVDKVFFPPKVWNTFSFYRTQCIDVQCTPTSLVFALPFRGFCWMWLFPKCGPLSWFYLKTKTIKPNQKLTPKLKWNLQNFQIHKDEVLVSGPIILGCFSCKMYHVANSRRLWAAVILKCEEAAQHEARTLR